MWLERHKRSLIELLEGNGYRNFRIARISLTLQQLCTKYLDGILWDLKAWVQYNNYSLK